MNTPRAARPTNRRFQLRLALLVALGVFAQESVWNFHDSQTPVTLAGYTTSVALIGLIMGLDNIIGIFVQPLMGFLSDRTRSRWGRRTPFIVLGVPVAAALFMLIPLAPSFPILIAVIVLFSLTANSFKPITESLLADQQVPEHRSKANAFGRFASGLTIVVSALLSLFVVDESVELAYVIAAAVMVACFAILLISLREPRTAAYRAVVDEDAELGVERTGFFAVFKDIFTDRDRSRLFMIVAIIVAWGAWAAIRALLTLYGVEQLGLSRGDAGGLTLPASAAFLIFVIPVAILSDRIGRRLVMRIGVVIFALGALVAFFFNTSPTATLVGVLIAAAGWTGFAVNATVMLWNLAPSQRLIGVYTGIFAVAQAVGSSIGPAALGALVDVSDWSFLMLYLAAMALVGLLLTFGVRREYAPSQVAEERFVDAERAE
ncbi:MFS transporter [Microbacterium terricola]|uniref:MFS transporter n=1 Tax=Microbacterium terricola TaxID=344163 RepID=A0ABM8DVI2_9MICO|nr:MFS transporter [Microbacterium terricola]UYK39659.1 MFS transporter [Microbacterium terricola]BDV29599.1 MFS transporter [Microbacterium terricola]